MELLKHEYNILTQASHAATKHRETLERVLFETEPKTIAAMIVFAELKAAEAREKELRAFVRNHPEHNYDGL